MSQTILYFLFPVLLIFFTACSSDDIEIDGITTITIENCFQINEEEIIINDKETYEKMLANIDNSHPTCRNYELPNINFAEKTLLGKLTTIKGCQVFYTREVTANTDKKAYVYTIDVVRQGSCDSTWVNYNWITVPKLPSQYTVQFQVRGNDQ